jgi:DNA polymerase I-like protein with 3'-5' exonuclease and polymerase domains
VEQAYKYGVPEAEIRPLVPDLQAGLRKLYPGFFAWARAIQDLERIPGLFGRTHVPPPGYDDNARRREAVNAPIQGGAVDCVKLAALKAESGGFDTRHMIHDDIWVQVPVEDATPDWEADLKRALETAVKLTVPLEVEVKRWEPQRDVA